MIEDDLDTIKMRLREMSCQLARIEHYMIPTMKDVSKHIAEAKELANKGKKPRKQPKAGTTILAVEKVTDEMVNKAVLGSQSNP